MAAGDRAAEAAFLLGHTAHDFRHLIARWRALGRKTGLRVEPLVQHGDYPIFQLSPRRPRSGPAFYFSACIHGDEPASAWGLLHWAEASLPFLSESEVLIFPCLNPWGLIENRRSDHRDDDLNRLFKSRRHPLVKPWASSIEGRRFLASFCLHEDFDARGAYLYELCRRGEGVGKAMLHAAQAEVGIEPRASVEGRPCKDGLLFRRRIPAVPWEAEAMMLYRKHTDLSLTFETPSEASLFRRVRAQSAALNAGVSAVLKR